MRKMRSFTRMVAPEGEDAGADPANPGGGNGTAAGTATPATPPTQAVGRGSKVITIQRSTLAKQVKDAAAKAQADERAALDKRARQFGYKSLDDMMRSRAEPAARAAKPAASAGTARPAAAASDADKRYQREIDRRERNLQAERRARISAQRLKKAAELDRDAMEAERALERIAVKVGVRDTDYAIHLYSQHCAGKTEDELAKLDEEAFFTGLKTSNPYIFGERPVTEVLATTATVPGQTPTPPGPRAAAAQAANADKFNARTASKEEVAARAAKYGLRMPGG